MGWRKGELIMEAKPYALVILKKFRQQRCNFCLIRAESLLKCGACKKVKYCGASCQKEDWKIHKQECSVMSRVPDIPTDSILLFLRLIIRHLMGKSSMKFETTESPCLRSFNDLESHSSDIKKDKNRYELFTTAADFIRAYASGILQVPSEEVLLDIFGKMVINTFTVADEMLQDVAVAVYSSPSILDHRCRPNSVASFIGRRVLVRAVEDIAEEDFSKVYLSYLDPLATRAERQQALRCQYYFSCGCDRCQDSHLESLMTDMGKSNEGDQEQVKQCLEQLDAMGKENASPRSLAESGLKCLSEVNLPHTHVHLVRLVAKTYDAAVEAEMWSAASELGRRNLTPYRQLNPPYTTSVGYLMASLGKLLVFLEELREARALLRQAIELLIICLGTQHSLVHEVKELIQQCDIELGALA